MPLRMIIDGGAVGPTDVALVGARDLDPPEREFIDASGLHTGKDAVAAALDGADAVYVAIDGDGLDDAEVASWMPVPGRDLRRRGRRAVALRSPRTGRSPAPASPAFSADPANVEPATRLCSALGL